LDLTQRLSFRDVFGAAMAGRSAGPESIAPAVVMDSGLAYAALRASHAPRNDDLLFVVVTDRNDSNFANVELFDQGIRR
jgi:hypothetical protein